MISREVDLNYDAIYDLQIVTPRNGYIFNQKTSKS